MATIFGQAKGVTGRAKTRDKSMYYEAEADHMIRDLVKVSTPGSAAPVSVNRRLELETASQSDERGALAERRSRLL
jgi:hypothetical protein